jgi:hypothetical protein
LFGSDCANMYGSERKLRRAPMSSYHSERQSHNSSDYKTKDSIAIDIHCVPASTRDRDPSQ